MKLFLMLLIMVFLVSCSPKFHVGQRVTNGYCHGYIGQILGAGSFGYSYVVNYADCGEFNLSPAVFDESELKEYK